MAFVHANGWLSPTSEKLNENSSLPSHVTVATVLLSLNMRPMRERMRPSSAICDKQRARRATPSALSNSARAGQKHTGPLPWALGVRGRARVTQGARRGAAESASVPEDSHRRSVRARQGRGAPRPFDAPRPAAARWVVVSAARDRRRRRAPADGARAHAHRGRRRRLAGVAPSPRARGAAAHRASRARRD